MKHSVKHDLDHATAKKVTERAFESYAERFSDYSPTAEWKGDSLCEVGFTVKGVKLTGLLEIQEREILMDLDVPFIFRPFKKKALDVIEREVETWIEKAKSGELT
ncbi:MAG: polyhydroxyalkanoic acid system family protein [Myxococcota bacterium]